MRFCIIGTGAIGGFIGARLALAGEDVTFVARHRNFEAIKGHGLHLVHPDGGEAHAKGMHVTEHYTGAGPFDVVLLALKANQLASVAPRVESLCHERTMVVPMQNGIPFWYFEGQPGPHAGRAVASVDPHGRILDAIPARRIVGCVVYIAAERVAPGRIAHHGGQRLLLGEIEGEPRERTQRLAAAFARAGIEGIVTPDIRAEVWLKLWGNLTFNPISALTHAPLSEICADPHGRALAVQMMGEAEAVANQLGITFRVTMDQRIEGAARVGRHKTSMLQDVEAGRAIEIDALVGSVVELGELVGVATPTISAIYRAAKLLEATIRSDRVAVRSAPLPAG